MKPLKPSHRERKRYLLIKGKDANKNKIEKTILEFIGILGYAKASPQFISIEKNRIILAINRESLNEIKSSFITSNKDIQMIKVSGTLKGVKNK
ncbi:hypothetical protein CMI42_06240 [Candidatus Pacearchaeota archaeon]|nr:hypothetical protein [Candidatus Pacearchaeota archaeon]|tara:strand:- start:982 stop:1263 length:282 start_codon:yes stop_codon:yes gene_type:complete